MPWFTTNPEIFTPEQVRAANEAERAMNLVFKAMDITDVNRAQNITPSILMAAEVTIAPDSTTVEEMSDTAALPDITTFN